MCHSAHHPAYPSRPHAYTILASAGLTCAVVRPAAEHPQVQGGGALRPDARGGDQRVRLAEDRGQGESAGLHGPQPRHRRTPHRGFPHTRSDERSSRGLGSREVPLRTRSAEREDGSQRRVGPTRD